jgi:hypothetical protein
MFLYHEKRIALVNNFVYLVPLKNIVQGRKGYSKAEKRFPWESSFPLFLSLGKKSGKELPLGNLFSTFEYPFFPGTIFFSRTR